MSLLQKAVGAVVRILPVINTGCVGGSASTMSWNCAPYRSLCWGGGQTTSEIWCPWRSAQRATRR